MPTTAEAVRMYFAAIRSLDVDRFVDVFAPDAVSHDPVGASPHVGHEGIRSFFAGVSAAFSELDLSEADVFVCGTSAATKWTGSGTGRNGKQVRFEGIDVFECDDTGKIVQVRVFWDPKPVMAVLQS